MPNHAHPYTYSDVEGLGGSTATIGTGDVNLNVPIGATTGAIGGGGAHSHTMDMNVAYVDAIIAVKD
jgi:hypothetical protein